MKTTNRIKKLEAANGEHEQESKPAPVGFTPIKYQLRRAIVVLEGLEPGLLMNSKRLMQAKENAKGHMAPEIECELRCHWTGEGKNKTLAFPWMGFYRSICKAAQSFKWRNRKSMESALASTIACNQDMISLGTKEYRPFRAFVKIPPRTGAMIEIDRPLVYPWRAEIELIVDDGTPQPIYDINLLPTIINDAGRFVGIGANSPGLKGPNGKFQVTEWKILE